MSDDAAEREAVARARRVVVKIGSRVLVQRNGRPDPRRMRALVEQVAREHHAGREMVVVTSGAIAAGMEALGLARRPKAVPDLQMAAAVGQTRLMTRYERLFRARQCRVGQVLLTHDGLKLRERHLNARNTLENLLRHRIVPIINENDAVAVEEIRFGDNDLLGALVAILLGADLLLLLTTVDGLRAPAGGGRTRRVPRLTAVTEKELQMVFGSQNEISTGGMASKLQSADLFVRSGGQVVIADGRRAGAIRDVLAGADAGTLIGGLGRGRDRDYKGRRRWIAFFHKTEGAIAVDEGARQALEKRGTSLLPIGVRGVEGAFEAGAVVDVKGPDGRVVGRGVAEYAADEIRRIQGHRTGEIAGLLGYCDSEEVIHRDQLVVFGAREGESP
jgi:glutamate 5-kinase